jgi:diguanylate cyclase (GGDEF)-like protein
MAPVNLAGRPGRNLLESAVGALIVTLALLANAARADCFGLTDPDFRSIEALSFQDPNKALEATKVALAAAQRASHPDGRHIATLYAVTAQSYSLLELDADARSASLTGLNFAPDPTDPTHLALQTAYAENIYDSDGISGAITTIETARRSQVPGSRADLCLQITLGVLQNRRGRSDLAMLVLTNAYGTSRSLPFTEPRVAAADALSPVMRGVGDFAQALALNQEVIDWELRHHAKQRLSVSRYLRGQILSEMQDYKAAIAEIGEARKLSVELADRQGVAFADLATCRARLESGQLSTARADCESALRVFSAAQSADVVKESQTLLAQIDLAEGHAGKALSTLNDVLAKGGEDIQPRQLPSVYELRARANATLHNYADAYRDLDEYSRRYAARMDAERGQQVAALRARFETDREIERNAALHRELELANEHAERQRVQLRWVVVAIGASGLVIALLMYLLITHLRYRKRLLRLANEDSLTGLPNRGRTAAVATEALATAVATEQPLCIALIDLDRFKALNDRFGHATGDCVLKEFTRIATASLRATDTLGRWGGEEFLLVLPNTTLDTAVEILDRIRQQATLIQQAVDGWDLRVSISAGLATNGDGASSLDEIVARADVALYKAKNAGRDLVQYAEESYQSASTGVRRALRHR